MKYTSTAYVALAAFCWGLSGGIGGMLIADDWDPFVVSFYRGLIGLFFVVVWLMISPIGSGLKNYRLWFWSVVAGLGVAGNFAFYFVSIDQGSVAVAATLMYCAPVFVYLVSFALKLESPTLLKWIAIALVMFGIVLLTEIYDVDSDGVTLFGVVAGLLAGISYTVFIFGFKYAASYGSPQAILSIAFMVLTLILIWPGDSVQTGEVLEPANLPLFTLLGILGAGLSFILYVNGLNYTVPGVASIVAMVEPVTASLFGVFVLSESLTITQIFGMVLILITATVMSLFSGSGRTPSRFKK
ncbi:MAG: EamA family transporter [Balneolaceae bacterium]|nr:EamA family transporter [Balneolaceae bacterium]MCH8548193.1 DMT family transporter [Balneolaceae bacterium]